MLFFLGGVVLYLHCGRTFSALPLKIRSSSDDCDQLILSAVAGFNFRVLVIIIAVIKLIRSRVTCVLHQFLTSFHVVSFHVFTQVSS